METATFYKTVENVEARPMMFLDKQDFNSASHFFVGYFSGIKEVSGIDINQNISKWLPAQNNTQSSLFWTSYIFNILANKDTDTAYALTFVWLKKYFAETTSINI